MLSRFRYGFAAGLMLASALGAAEVRISGRVLDPQERPVAGSTVRLSALVSVTADADGRFAFPPVPAGVYRITATSPGFLPVGDEVNAAAGKPVNIELRFTRVSNRSDSLTIASVAPQTDISHPDPTQKIFVHDEILDANPGRPGAPISIPGLPVETASGGIKAPQYFAPGVAGDHGEPIATFFQVGGYLVPNNLSANAHGNGYADPNMIVPAFIEAVQSDGGAFNVREGNHSVNVAETWSFRPRLEPFVTVTGDQRDADVSAGWNSIAVEAAYGNGFLDRLEHRQQYKVNGFHAFQIGRHELTLFAAGYFGRSMIPGLVPVGVSGLHDTIDARQKDETHTGEIALNDAWNLSPDAQLQSSAFFRTYSLALYSNFGDGLIRQSEFRTVEGGNETYVRRISNSFSLMAGLDYLRDAPRRLDLDHYLSNRSFEKVTANNVTLNIVTPFVALEGSPFHWLRYNLGWRRDEIQLSNQDLLRPANSSNTWVGVNSPKATVSFIAPERSLLPTVSLSFGQAFFTNDRRTGDGSLNGTPVSRAHSYQLVVSKYLGATELRATFGRTTQEASLAKIDADTGLQYDEGPSRNRYVTLAVRRRFSAGSFEASFSKADARDLIDGLPIPEAPRLIADAVGSIDRLPWRLRARGEFEYVGAKPLGDGFTGVAVREFRGAIVRPILSDRATIGVNFLLASGYTGQTTEVLDIERVVGVYLPSYATLSFTYRFSRRSVP